jgi:hypothetical protein
MTGASGVPQFRKNTDGYLEVYLQFNTDESYIIQTSAKKIAGISYPYIREKRETTEITGTWSLKFLEGGPSLPVAEPMDALKPWTELKADAFKTFSGTASYNTNFKKPAAVAKQYVIDLGKVYESAQVFINGKKVATLIGPDFSFTIAANDLKADNLLEIKISNSMANRIIDLDKRKVIWKKFNNTNFPARFPQNRGAGGLFDASKWDPKVSGLQGPVTISAIN